MHAIELSVLGLGLPDGASGFDAGSCAFGALAIQPQSVVASAGATLVSRLCAGASDMLSCLQGLRASDVAAVSVGTADPLVDAFYPWVDGQLFTDPPEVLLGRGAIPSASLLIGTNHDEWDLFRRIWTTLPVTTVAGMQIEIAQVFPAHAQEIDAHYLPASDADAQRAFSRLMTDVHFRCPSRALLRGVAAHGNAAYLYDFDVPPAGHTLELDYVFGETITSPIFAPDAPRTPKPSVVTAMQGHWTAFAARSDPSAPGFAAWPAYAAATDANIVLADPVSIARSRWWRLRLLGCALGREALIRTPDQEVG